MQTRTKKLALMAVLTASALIIFIIEAQVPLPIPIPGVKLGLANAITLFALFFGKDVTEPKTTDKSAPHTTNTTKAVGTNASEFADTAKNTPTGAQTTTLTTKNALAILLCRIILGAVLIGQPIAIAFSLAGGLLGFAAQIIMKRFVTKKQIWVCGAVGAVFHNIGQILAAILLTGTTAIAAYLPILILSGIITGAITGLIAQLTLLRYNTSFLK